MTFARQFVVGLEALADELERWSTYAHGAIDETVLRHRHTQERVRRAERMRALATDGILADRTTLAELDVDLERLGHDHDGLWDAIRKRLDALTLLIAASDEVRETAHAALRTNSLRQEQAAAKVSLAMRGESRARAALHRSLERQREALSKRWRPKLRAAATAAQDRAEHDARLATETLQVARAELADLTEEHAVLVAGLTGLDDDLETAATAIEELGAALRTADEAAEELHAARGAWTAAAAAVSVCADLSESMNEAHARATDRFDAARESLRGIEVTYEEAQRLATDYTRHVRDCFDAVVDDQRVSP